MCIRDRRTSPSGPLRARQRSGPATRPRAARARVHRARSGRRVGGPGMLSRLTPMLIRMSTLFVRTLREDPADAEVPSHRLLVRAGYIRRAAPGVYTWPVSYTHLRAHETRHDLV